MPKILDHIHTYVRWKVAFGELQYRCANPDCLHTAPVSLIEGKRSICSKCGLNELILSKEDLRRVKPMCVECSNTKEAKSKKRFKNIVSDLFQEETEKEKPNANS